MYKLRNNLSAEQAKAKLALETIPRKTLSFYRYVHIEHPETLRDTLYEAWDSFGVLGRIYLAHEGINAQMSIPENQLEAFRDHLNRIPEFSAVPFKFALEEPTLSFWKLVIKVRKQIVADNLPADAYDISNVGNHLDAQTFNEAIEQGAVVVDMRNKYESDIGRFETAITPSSQTFADELQEVKKILADKKDEKILLYCTGGIRCEKASAFLKHEGFSDVNQLFGGIINYKHEIAQKGLGSKFRGKNYVFDNRGAEKVTDDILGSCHTCKTPADTYHNCASDLCHALFIQCATCFEKTCGTCSSACQAIAMLPLEERKALRKKHKAGFAVRATF